MAPAEPAKRIDWYRSPVPRERLRELTRRNDLRGLVQALGFLSIYLVTTATSLYFFLNRMWVPMVFTAYLHSMFTGFLGMGSAVHELSHFTVFKSRRLNEIFYWLFAFLTWNSGHHFRESHKRHHQYTAHDAYDLEVPREPARIGWLQLLGWFTFDWAHFINIVGTNIQHALGNTDADFFFWSPLIPKDDARARKLVTGSRVIIIGHLILLAVFIYFRLWILIYTVSFGYFFATFLVHSCEIQQHSGLSHNVPDWRLNAYTVKFGPVMRFLYWNMNFHVEHHMYAAVPFYNLPELSEELETDLAKPLKGYFGGLAHVIRLKWRQKADPDFRHVPEFPDTAKPPKRA